jgi:hypothetical protein
MKYAGAMDKNKQCQATELDTNHIKNTGITMKHRGKLWLDHCLRQTFFFLEEVHM